MRERGTSLATLDQAHKRRRHPMKNRQLSTRQSGRVRANLARLLVRKFARAVACPCPVSVASLHCAVPIVVGDRAKPQVARVDAPAVVAGMAHAEMLRRRRAVGNLKGEAVRADHGSIVPSSAHAPVAERTKTRKPWPAFTRPPDVYLGPKSFYQPGIHASIYRSLAMGVNR